MAKRNKWARRQFTAVHTLCCILFCVLTFIYLYFYQGDILALAQHVLSGEATTYDKFVGASVITTVLFLIHSFVYSIIRLDRWFYWLTYLPSFLILAILTDISLDNDGTIYNTMWLWLAPIIILLYIIMVRLFSEVDSLGKDDTTLWLFSKVMWFNLLCITLMMLIVTAVCSTDVTMQHRIKTEALILKGDYDGALSVGNKYKETDKSLTMLRAYALASKGELAERLFEYPLTGGSKALIPNGEDVKTIMIHNSDIMKFIHTKRLTNNNVSRDYKLCGYLLDKRLDDFEHNITKYYRTTANLPKHYKEALIMANNIIKGDTLYAADSVMVAEYKEFKSIKEEDSTPDVKSDKLKARFSKTYWYYYLCR